MVKIFFFLFSFFKKKLLLLFCVSINEKRFLIKFKIKMSIKILQKFTLQILFVLYKVNEIFLIITIITIFVNKII